MSFDDGTVSAENYIDKIKTARNFLIKKIEFSEPTYYIWNKDYCYNAITNETDKIGLTEAIVKELSPEELAGSIAHEFGHIEAMRLGKDKELKHWEIDVIGAGFTTKQVMIKNMKRMLQKNDAQFEKYKLVIYTMPLSFLIYKNYKSDWETRIEKVEQFAK